ncbi:MAG: hypothetical protein IPO49_10895 [Bacteroidetes bacterium]|nr:hypothetical protein [Bacteroidota bacterium]
MTGTLAQLIALTTYGNEFLKKGSLEPPFYPENSTFQFCKTVDFHEFRKRLFSSKYNEVKINADPNEWFLLLKKEKTKVLHLFYRKSEDEKMSPDHKMAGFVGGGGTWMIEQRCEGFSYYWQARWTVNNDETEDRNRWTVNYGRFDRKIKSTNLVFSGNMIREELRKTLSDISAFAYSQNQKGWSETFQKALYELSNQTPEEHYYHKDLLPPGAYSLESRQLLYSAAMSWVFGGMGSWNDIIFDDPEVEKRYDELSAKLYGAINDSVLAVVNVVVSG